jgi:Na+-driven multidrug efflux pump
MITASMIMVPLTYAEQIIRIFITPKDPGFDQVASMTSQFLIIAAVFMVFDGL